MVAFVLVFPNNGPVMTLSPYRDHRSAEMLVQPRLLAGLPWSGPAWLGQRTPASAGHLIHSMPSPQT